MAAPARAPTEHPASRKLPRQKRSTSTVANIVEAAALVLEARGIAGYNTNAVAERAGVSVGSLYQYFANKAALTHALMEQEDEAIERELASIAACAPGLELLRRVIHVAVSRQARRPVLARLLGDEVQRMPPSRHAARLTELLEAVFRRSFKGSPLEHQPQAAADIFAIIVGLMESAQRRGEVDTQRLGDRLTGAVFGYVDACTA